MDLLQAMKGRHSVRSYINRKINDEIKHQLIKTVDECNNESGLNIQLCFDEPNAFRGFMARYGKFKNVKNYIALVGSKSSELEQKCGYYGEKLVLKAQQLGLNTCWVGMSYSKGKCQVNIKTNERLLMVIALGYGETQGMAHKTKPVESLSRGDIKIAPEWFQKGLEAAQLAPTALNQQKFCFEYIIDNTIKATTSLGFYVKTDLGIAKYHFEIGAEKEINWQ